MRSKQLVTSLATVTATAIVLVAGQTPQAAAWPPYLNDFQNAYQGSLTAEANCQVCHVDSNGGEPWNAYGWKLREFVFDGVGLDEAITMADGLDSDGDPGGFSNGDEADADTNTQPGWTVGPNNTHFFTDGSTTDGQMPPPLPTDYDPVVTCEGDANGDLVVNVDDLLIVLGGWGMAGDGDVNDDGNTDVDDLLLVLANWGVC